jgi:hypothetical protein
MLKTIETPSSTLTHSNLTFTQSKKPKLEKAPSLWGELRVGCLTDYPQGESFTC